MGIQSLADIVQSNNDSELFDGSIYVFYNSAFDKIKCIYWDKNGVSLFYKKLHGLKFKLKHMTRNMEELTQSQLAALLSGGNFKKEDMKGLENMKTLKSGNMHNQT